MSLSLFERLCGRKKEKVFQLENTQIKMRILTQSDIDEVFRSTSIDDFYTKSETTKRPTLARAIIEIDNRPIDSYPEVVERLNKRREAYPNENPAFAIKLAIEEFLGTLPASNIHELYKAYSVLVEEDRKESEGLKKNWVAVSPEQSGK